MIFSYERDAYLETLETEVLAVGETVQGPWAVTADTVFYPEGGGQPADRGVLGPARVLDVQKVGDRVRHLLSEPVAEGAVVQVLDWPRRYDHMQQHTAQHLLTAVADREFSWATTAFHLGPQHSDVELDVSAIGEVQLAALEERVNAEVRAARPVSARCVAPEDLESLAVRSRGLPEGHRGMIRLVEIEGLDRNTCGGTHLRSTAEIGVLCLLGTESLRGGTRVFFVAGERVRRRLRSHELRNAELRALLGGPDEEFAELVRLRLEREKELGREKRRLQTELAEAVAARLAGCDLSTVARHWEQAEMPFLQAVARRLRSLGSGATALLTAGGDDAGVFVLAAADDDAGGQVFARVCELLEARGGGAGGIYQGKAARLDRRAELLAELGAEDLTP